MAKSTAAIEVEVLPKGSADTVVKNFKTQLREAKIEAQQIVITFGEFSDEAIAAQKRVAELAEDEVVRCEECRCILVRGV